MSVVVETLQVGVLVLIAVAAVASLVVVWWDDHDWWARRPGAGAHLAPVRHPCL